MKIDVHRVAKLANLTVTEEEVPEFEKQLGEILTYIEKLNSVDTSKIETTAQITGLSNRVRTDEEVYDNLSQEEALSGGKNTHNGLFVVDKLVDTT